MRRYEEIWQKLKLHKKLTIRCKVPLMDRVIQAVRKEKATENAAKRALQIPFYGELTVEKKEKDGKIIFGLPEKMVISVVGVTAEDL